MFFSFFGGVLALPILFLLFSEYCYYFLLHIGHTFACIFVLLLPASFYGFLYELLTFWVSFCLDDF